MTGLDSSSIRSVLRSGAPRCADAAPGSTLRNSRAAMLALVIGRSGIMSRTAGAAKPTLDRTHVGVQAAFTGDARGIEGFRGGSPRDIVRHPARLEIHEARRQVGAQHLAGLKQ